MRERKFAREINRGRACRVGVFKVKLDRRCAIPEDMRKRFPHLFRYANDKAWRDKVDREAERLLPSVAALVMACAAVVLVVVHAL